MHRVQRILNVFFWLPGQCVASKSLNPRTLLGDEEPKDLEMEGRDGMVNDDLGDDGSDKEGAISGDVLNLTFIGREYVEYGTHKGDHGKLDLAYLAYCYAKYFSKDAITVNDWEKLFVFDKERKAVPLDVCDEVCITIFFYNKMWHYPCDTFNRNLFSLFV